MTDTIKNALLAAVIDRFDEAAQELAFQRATRNDGSIAARNHYWQMKNELCRRVAAIESERDEALAHLSFARRAEMFNKRKDEAG